MSITSRREKEFALVGSIYKGQVTRVLPGMQSAFVEIGLDSDAFLYVSDFLEEIEELDHVVTTVEDKAQKMEEQGGQVFPANTGTAPIIEPLDVESPACCGGGERAGATNRCRVNPFRLCADHRRLRFRRRSLVHPAAATATIADASRIVRAAAGLAETAVDALAGAVAVVADADAAAVAVLDRGGDAAVLGANFPLRSTLRHGHPRITRASRARRKDTSPTLLPGESLAKFKERSPSDPSASR